MTRKNYQGPLVDVSFDKDICTQAGECIRGMPIVFDINKRPWVSPEMADTAESGDFLREVVGRCPSGALRIEEHA